MSDNWLATAGEWLATPLKIIARPWWDKLVEKKAEEKAIQLKLLEAVVQFRVSDFANPSRGIDADKAVGIAKKVVDRLKPRVTIDLTEVNVTSDQFLRDICNEIQLCGVPETVWVELACLAAVGKFNLHHVLTVDFVDDNGSHSRGSVGLAAVQSAFPFWQHVFVMDDLSQPFMAKVSPQAIGGLSEYVSRATIPESRYTLSPTFPNPALPLDGSALSLPKGWRPPC
jgi:hypothetical protein